MAFDGNGNWVSTYYPTQDRDNDIAILASKFETLIQTNIKSSFEKCATTDSQTLLTENFNVNGYQLKNVSAGLIDTDGINKLQLDTVKTDLQDEIDNITQTWIDLNDTPSTYTGQAGKVSQVNSTEDGMELVDAPQGATAWGSYVGTGTPSVQNDFNLGTISKTSTGRYTLTFDTAMDNANYSVLITMAGTTDGGYGYSSWIKPTGGKTTTEFKIECGNLGGFNDVPILCVAVFGGKA